MAGPVLPGVAGVAGIPEAPGLQPSRLAEWFRGATHSALNAIYVLEPLRGRHFQPVAGLLRLMVARLAIQLAELQLGIHITGASGLAQQLKTHAPITRVAAITAQHLPQPTLRLHHTLQSRLLKQMTSKAFDARGVTEARIVQ